MADLNSTIVRGKLRVTEDINTTGDIYINNVKVLTAHPTITKETDTTSTASPSHGGTFTVIDSITRETNGHVIKVNTKTVTLPSDNDTKNTAGSTDTDDKIFLIGAKSQAASPQTFSDGNTYVTNGALTTNSLSLNGSISYRGTKATYAMIKFIDNTGDTYGNGISIGGGGAVVIGGGEAADTIVSGAGVSGGTETLYLGSDDVINFYSNVQSGLSEAKTMTFDTAGTLTINGKAAITEGYLGFETSTSNKNYAVQKSTGGKLYVNVPWTDTDTNTWRPVSGNGTSIGNNSLNIKPGSNVSVSVSGGDITISSTDTNTDTKNTAGSTNTSDKLFLIGATSQAANPQTYSNINVYTTSGNLYASALYASSDKRLKENIKSPELNYSKIINNIALKEFSWKSDNEHKRNLGVIAQELREIIPEQYRAEFIGGKETETEYLSINDSKLIYLVIGALKEQQQEIKQLKAELNKIKEPE